MRIAVNTRFLLKDKMEGFGWYTHEVFRRITTQHPEHEFIFVFDRPYDAQFVYAPNITPVKAGPPARHPWLFYWWFEHSIPRVLKKHKADIFISPDGYLGLNIKIPCINVIHDLNFEHYPQDLKPHITRYYKTNFPRFARKATHILTVSGYSKNDIATTYGISPHNITVAHNGADEAFVPAGSHDIADFKADFKQATGVSQPFFLSVGSIHARKNINRLLQGFELFKQQTNSAWQLLVVGDKYNWTAEMNHTLENMAHKRDVIFTGHLTKTRLIQAYSAAAALVFPSYFEGFGIPLVEAMRCDCPVICANTTSFPEVAGDAAVYFNPFDVNDMARALADFAGNTALAQQLIVKGRERAKAFNWQNTADIVWQTIETTARAKGILK